MPFHWTDVYFCNSFLQFILIIRKDFFKDITLIITFLKFRLNALYKLYTKKVKIKKSKMKNHKWWEIGSHILLEKYYKYFFLHWNHILLIVYTVD